ncbi:MAG: hypothetical protein PHH77_00860 [Victivallaceae bacterium]|nr:hypothetical protein [Victivallaceae bacterium]
MSIFEAVMMVCFGASWPLAIYKTYTGKNPAGKSLPFLYLVLVGYLSGLCHKVFINYNWVFFLYLANFLMVGADIILTKYYLYKNRRLT